MDTWIAFAKTVNLNYDGLSEWPAHDEENRSTMFLRKECKVVKATFETERAVWDGILEF